jgi:hypothetical protein
MTELNLPRYNNNNNLTGGAKKAQYNFTENIKEDYKNYLDKLAASFKNKKELTEITYDKIIYREKSTKKILKEIKRPIYTPIRDVLEEINKELSRIKSLIDEQRVMYTHYQNPETLKTIKTLKDEYLKVHTNYFNVLTYHKIVNNKEEKETRVRELINKRTELKEVLRTLFFTIKEKNKREESVTKELTEYLAANKITDIDNEIKTLLNNDNIDYIIQMEEIKRKEQEETLPEPSPELAEQSIIEPTISQEDADLEQNDIEQDFMELSYYENKPNVPEEDIVLPDITDREELKKKLLSKSKKKKQNKKIYGSKKSPDGKTRRKMKGVPVREGDCIIPFTYEGTQKTECEPSKLGEWCATNVDEKNNVVSLGFCEVESKKK